jgi:hypothetical protein
MSARQARLDTDDQIAAVALPQAQPHRKPWLLYTIALAGVAVGALGVVFGLRGADDRAVSPAPPAVTDTLVPATRPAATATGTAAVAVAAPAAVSKVELHLDANVPGAHVTFRGRVHDAPAALEVNESDIVELVEVAAPGYKIQRYWLTFDRPTHLTARMIKGDGLNEATEDQTLIALGEMAEPVAEPVSASAAAPAAPPRRVTIKLPPRRKIGRAAVTPLVVPAPAGDALSSTEPAPSVATPTEGVLVGPAPAPAGIDATTGVAAAPAVPAAAGSGATGAGSAGEGAAGAEPDGGAGGGAAPPVGDSLRPAAPAMPANPIDAHPTPIH